MNSILLKNALLLLFGLLFTINVFAQNVIPHDRSYEIDSLKQNLLINEFDHDYIKTLLSLSTIYNQIDVDSALFYADEAVKISLQINNQSDLQKSYHLKGVAHYYQAEYSEALKDYFESLSIAESLKDTASWNGILQNLGKVYEVRSEHDKAYQYYEEGLELLNEESSPKLRALAYSNMANILFYKRKYEESLAYHKKAIKIRKAEGTVNSLAYSYNDIAIVYRSVGEIGQALRAYKESYAILTRLDDQRGLTHVAGGISGLYSALRKLDSALYFAQESYEIASNIDARHEKIGAAAQLADLYERKGNYKSALMFERQAHDLYDSVFTQEKMREVAQLENQAKFSEQEARTRLLEEQKKAQEARMDKQLVVTVASIIIIFLLIGVIMIFIKERLKQRELTTRITAANDLLQQQQIELAQKNTEVKERNERLNTLNEEKNHLIGVVAHDLRNPLTSALTLSQLLECELEGDDKECIQGVSNAMLRMNEMITRILDVKAIEAGHMNLQFRPFDIDEIVESVVEHCEHKAKRKNIQIIQKLKPVTVYADPNGVKQVLDNLLSNAIKFSPSSEEVVVKVSVIDEKNVEVIVQDNGPGISEIDKKKMFGRFQRLSAKPTGGESSTGLGLSIAKKLIDAMNGDIQCESCEGQGSSFIIKVPLHVSTTVAS